MKIKITKTLKQMKKEETGYDPDWKEKLQQIVKICEMAKQGTLPALNNKTEKKRTKLRKKNKIEIPIYLPTTSELELEYYRGIFKSI